MAAVIARCGASSSPLPKPLPPLQGAARADGPPADAAPATPRAPPPRSYLAMRTAVEVLRPSAATASITATLREIGLGKDVVSPATGGVARRTR
eukprot:4217753-Prymnesium_polylepis.2